MIIISKAWGGGGVDSLRRLDSSRDMERNLRQYTLKIYPMLEVTIPLTPLDIMVG